MGYQDKTWFENGFVKLDSSRFLEYTAPDVKEKVKDNLFKTRDYPCLIMNEGNNPDIYLGRIIKIDVEGRYLIIYFNVINEVKLKFSDIEPFVSKFDIRDWEISRTHWAVKDRNLDEALLSNDLGLDVNITNIFRDYLQRIPQKIDVKGLDNSSIGESIIEFDDHKEIKNISGVTDFIENIISFDRGDDYVNFYRGHADLKYKLEPSIFRKSSNGSFQYLENEDTIYNELLTQNYGEFDSDNSTFDRLVRMQHFTLPTRLLDISTNPLIALYFACKGNEGLSGDAILIQVPREKVKYFDSDTAACIANLCKLTIKDKDILDIGTQDIKYRNTINKLYSYIKNDKPYFENLIKLSSINDIVCIKGKVTNDRINAQSGAFLLFGLDLVLRDRNKFGFKVMHFAIKPDIKKKILKDLDLLNINESTLFPYLENSAKYISNKFKKN